MNQFTFMYALSQHFAIGHVKIADFTLKSKLNDKSKMVHDKGDDNSVISSRTFIIMIPNLIPYYLTVFVICSQPSYDLEMRYTFSTIVSSFAFCSLISSFGTEGGGADFCGGAFFSLGFSGLGFLSAGLSSGSFLISYNISKMYQIFSSSIFE